MKKRDETGIMAKAVNEMRSVLRELVGNMERVKDDLIENMKRLDDVMRENNSISEDNSATTQELAAGMEETSASAAMIVSNIDAIRNQSSYGNDPTTEMKKQLKHEIEGMKRYLSYNQFNSDGTTTPVKCTDNDIDKGCENNSMTVAKFRTCIEKAYACLRKINTGLEAEKQRNARYPR